MFPLNTIIAWSINIIMNKKYDNNNIIIASRAYFLQDHVLQTRKMNHGDICMLCDQEKETATHLILDCAYARVVWHLLATGTDSMNI
jgi:hypothetical protein